MGKDEVEQPHGQPEVGFEETQQTKEQAKEQANRLSQETWAAMPKGQFTNHRGHTNQEWRDVVEIQPQYFPGESPLPPKSQFPLADESGSITIEQPPPVPPEPGVLDLQNVIAALKAHGDTPCPGDPGTPKSDQPSAVPKQSTGALDLQHVTDNQNPWTVIPCTDEPGGLKSGNIKKDDPLRAAQDLIDNIKWTTGPVPQELIDKLNWKTDVVPWTDEPGTPKPGSIKNDPLRVTQDLIDNIKWTTGLVPQELIDKLIWKADVVPWTDTHDTPKDDSHSSSPTQSVRPDTGLTWEDVNKQLQDIVRQQTPAQDDTKSSADRLTKEAAAAAEAAKMQLEEKKECVSIDLTDKETLKKLLEVIKAIEQGKVNDLDPEGQKLAQLLKGLAPEVLKLIRELIESILMKDHLDPIMLAYLRRLLGLDELPKKPEPAGQEAKTEPSGKTSNTTSGTADDSVAKPSTTALAQFLQSQRDSLVSGTDEQKREALAGLTKMLGDYNKDQPSDKQLTLADVMESMDRARSMSVVDLARLLLQMRDTGSSGDPAARAQLSRVDPRLMDAMKESSPGGKDATSSGIDHLATTLGSKDEATAFGIKDAVTAATLEGMKAIADMLDGAKRAPALAGSDPSAKDPAGRIEQTGQPIPDGASGAKPELVHGDPKDSQLPEKGALESDSNKGKRRKEEENAPEEVRKQVREQDDKEGSAKHKDKQSVETKEEPKQKEEERRQKYTVREGDTLESIASSKLHDRGLAPLIYEINSAVIPSWLDGNKRVLNLSPGLVLDLPSPLDIRDYRARPFSWAARDFEYANRYKSAQDQIANWQELIRAHADKIRTEINSMLFGDSASSMQVDASDRTGELESFAASRIQDESGNEPISSRQSRVERLLGPLSKDKPEESRRIKYTVRLGDTLRSIALNHPALEDAMLWKLLGEINDLSTAVDAKGTPCATLKRGSMLVLPSVEEIREFRRQQIPEVTPEAPSDSRNETAEQPATPGTDAQPSTNEITVTTELKIESSPDQIKPRRKRARKRASAAQVLGRQSRVVAEGHGSVREPLLQELSKTCRSVRSESEDGGLKKSCIEVRQKGVWKPVVVYEISQEVSVRHEYNKDGRRHTICVKLPPDEAQQLADYELSTYWKKYRRKFLSGLPLYDET